VEFRLLKVLADHPGRIYTLDQLLDAMYRDAGRGRLHRRRPGLGYKYEW
jgi:DNA-binding response OmpR family regulator